MLRQELKWLSLHSRQLFRSLIGCIGVGAFIGLASTTAQSQQPNTSSQVASYWREVTHTDVVSAHDLLMMNHPGTAPELHDVAFTPLPMPSLCNALPR